MQIFTLPGGTKFVDIPIGIPAVSIPAMALELMAFRETSWTSVSAPDIQEVSPGIYRVTFTDEQVAKQGYIIISLTGPGFNPFIGILFTVIQIDDSDPISGVPVMQDAFLPVQAFSGATPITGLTLPDFIMTFKRANELVFTPKTPTEMIEPVNEFSTARGIYLIKFTAAELSLVGEFVYTGAGSSFNLSIQILQVTEPTRTKAVFEVRDSTPDVATASPAVPTDGELTVFVGTTQPVNRLDFRFSQFGFGYTGLTFSYWDGSSFVSLTVQDETVAFTTDGAVIWAAPTNQIIGGTGAPNQTSYFIKITATSVSGDALLQATNAELLVAGVDIAVLDALGGTAASGTTSDLGQVIADLIPGTYIVVLRKADTVFDRNNTEVVILDPEGLAALGGSNTQAVILEGAFQFLPDPSIPPDRILLKTDLINIAGNPVQRQEIRLDHKFVPVQTSGTRTILGRTSLMLTDARGHAEMQVVSGSHVDVFLTNTRVSRQIIIPSPRDGTGDTLDPAPTPRFKSNQALFQAQDVQGIITISGTDYVITRVVDTTEIEVSPNIPSDLDDAAWEMKKVDIFSLIAVAPDQFSVAIPTFEQFAIRTTL
jgi:hypothetical protein